VLEPWKTVHNPRSLKTAWRLGIIGLPMSATWLMISLLAPVSVPIIQGIGILSLCGVVFAIVRLGGERVVTSRSGVLVAPAFRRSTFVPWPELASVESRSVCRNSPRGRDIEDLAAAIFDLDSHSGDVQTFELVIVTRSGRVVRLPMSEEGAITTIRESWQTYTRDFGKRLFAD
jgi:hypothetical protein